jgi:hypothetical protein
MRARLAERRSLDGADAAHVLSQRSGYMLDRALTRRLSHCYSPNGSMRRVLRDAISELLILGMNDAAILSLLSQIVEQLAASLGLDKRSLLTGQPDWLSTQNEVVEFARSQLGA